VKKEDDSYLEFLGRVVWWRKESDGYLYSFVPLYSIGCMFFSVPSVVGYRTVGGG